MDKIRDLIAGGKIDEAISELRKIIEANFPDWRNDIDLLSSQYHYQDRFHRLGLIPSNEYFHNLNKLIKALLETITDLLDVDINSQSLGEKDMSEPNSKKGFNYDLDRLMNQYKKDYLQDITKRKAELKLLINKNINDNTQKIYYNELREINDIEIQTLRSNLKHIKFVNREKEKDKIERESHRTQYWLLDGPTGYGKTELLKELHDNTNPDDTVRVWIQIDHEDDLSSIYDKFAKTLGIDDAAVPRSLNEKNMGGLLYELLYKTHKDSLRNKGKGLSIFIDFDGKPSIYFALFQTIIMQTFRKALERIPHFKTNPSKFKAVFAGRYLSKETRRREKTRLAIKIIPLSDFDFHAIRQTVSNHAGTTIDDTDEFLTEITAHILFLTGGHPLCISKALHILGELEASHLLSKQEEVYEFINLIAESIEFELLEEENWLFPMLQACSVFRFINLDILKGLGSLFQDIKVPKDVVVENQLRELQLWVRPRQNRTVATPNILIDGIARRVMNINLRQTDLEKFKEFCEFAMDTCLEHITSQNDSFSSVWLIEYLFQSLQIHAGTIREAAVRKKIREGFYASSGNFLKGVKAYKSTLTHDRLLWGIDTVIESIEENEEFQFIVNYYLRDENERYNDKPVKELKQKLNDQLNS